MIVNFWLLELEFRKDMCYFPVPNQKQSFFLIF